MFIKTMMTFRVLRVPFTRSVDSVRELNHMVLLSFIIIDSDLLCIKVIFHLPHEICQSFKEIS